MVFDLMGERVRYAGGKNIGFDGVEDAALIDALRACSSSIDQIGCLDFGDPLVLQVDATDGHSYIVQFSLIEPGFSVRASRVRITTLPLVGHGGEVDSTYHTLDILDDFSQQLTLDNVSTDRAFLIGMSLAIGLMDDQADDSNEDGRLVPLVALVMPNDDELREIRTKLPPSSINYDDEGDQPY
jgi:hypothetical protein